MKYLLIALASFLLPLVLKAAPELEAPPRVSCELSWDSKGSDGFTSERAQSVSVNVKPKGESRLKGFSLNANLYPSGPADGRVSWYELGISLQHGVHRAYRSDVTTNSRRQSLILVAGPERAIAKCDITP